VPASFKYGAEAMALMGIAYGLIKWVGRTLRSLISDSSLESARLQGIASQTPAASADALVRQGIVSAAQMERMSPREREFLVATAGPQLKAAASRAASGRPLTPAATEVIANATRVSRERSLTPPRLHLITPSRPPLGMTVHCPGCGAPVDRDGLQRTGSATCPRCKRPVSAHIQRGRITVIVEETPEEGDHRRRLDGER
jgi:hypothetical protein